MATIRVGAGAVVLGALMLSVGPLASAGAGEGFTACPQGTAKLVKFEAPSFNAEDKSVTAVTLINPTTAGGSWTSTVPIAAVVVKGGSGDDSRVITRYDPQATAGTYSNAGLVNGGGNVPDISFVEFCTAPATTTSSSSSTTASSSSSTTTSSTSSTTTTTTTTTNSLAPSVEGATEIPTDVLGEVLTNELPRTGAPVAANVLSVLGAGLIVGGLGLVVAGRRPWSSISQR
jgi:LPXTG-motif cell wall-anchored protein